MSKRLVSRNPNCVYKSCRSGLGIEEDTKGGSGWTVRNGMGSRVRIGTEYAVVHGDKVPMQPVKFWTAVDSSQSLGRKDSGKRQSIQGRSRITDQAYAASDTLPGPER